MSQNADMNPERSILGFAKKGIALGLLGLALVAVYLAATHRWPFAHHAAQPVSTQSNILYWYDAMNPQNHYNMPGKAPDGMELVPMMATPQSQLSITTSSETAQHKILYWYDPMHPAYKSDKPGIAPDCGMTLVPKYAEEKDAGQLPQGAIVVPVEKQALAGVRTALVERKALAREIHTTAEIVADESRISHVHVKVSGFIDRVYVNSIAQLVHKGQPLFTFYSPDLVATEEEYLIAKRGDSTLGSAPFKEIAQGAQSLLESARERLHNWDISDEQIRQLDQSGKSMRTLTIYSPVSGFVTDRKAYPQASITPDTEIYTISDLSSVWALADIYENEVPFVRAGQRVTFTLSYYPGKTYSGNISFISPTVDAQTRTVKVRVQLANPGYILKPQMFADAAVHVDYGTQIAVPREAVVDSGSEQLVYVAQSGGVFVPRKVTLGATVDDQVMILFGLKAGETVVTSGNFLIDSESRLKGAQPSARQGGVTP
jgi:RND family efflux transporter MFP subunit